MYLDEVEMRFAMDQVHPSPVLFFAIVVMDPAPFGGGYGLAHLRSLMSYLPALLLNLAQCTLGYSKLQEDTFSSCEIGPDNLPYKPMVSDVWLRYCVIILKSTSALTYPRACLKDITCDLCG